MRAARIAAIAAVLIGVTAAPPARASFPGRDGRIAFVRSGDIYTIRPDGTDLRRLTSTAETDGNPAWSPDGHRIAFTRLIGSNFEILTMASDGTGLRRLTSHTAVDKEPAWSRDGTRIAFASSRVGNYDIFTVRSSDGLGLRRATSSSFDETHPSLAGLVADRVPPFVEHRVGPVLGDRSGLVLVALRDGRGPAHGHAGR